jgi:hypothetical protein
MEPSEPLVDRARDESAETRRAIKAVALGAALGSVLAWLARRRAERPPAR